MKRALGCGSNQNFIEEINNEILTLFEKQENKPEYLPYFFPKDVKVNPDLLFLEINLSITEQTRGKIKEDNYNIENTHNQEIKTQSELLSISKNNSVELSDFG